MTTKITMHLPFPPSTNAIWRSNRGRVHRSKEYLAWLAEAGLEWLTQRGKQPKGIVGNFKAILVLNQDQRGQKDCDNRIKAVLDFCKSYTIIQDDKYCDALLVRWGTSSEAPKGARLILRPVRKSR